MTILTLNNKVKSKSIKERIKLIPIKKMATTKDIVDYIFYLIINNNFTTNEVINITGGE